LSRNRDNSGIAGSQVQHDARGRRSSGERELPSPALTLDGSEIVPGVFTVTVAVVLAILGVVVLAVMVAEPCPTGVTVTLTLF
jgi:hypothetical protein